MSYLTRVKTKLAIHAHHKVTGLLDGQYASLQRGRSLDFADLREYVLGDDIKDIDWKATARHGKPLIKRYVADRKHTLMLAISTGKSMAANATVVEIKSDVALMAAGLMGYIATKHGDYVGLYVVEGTKAEVLRPSMREVDVERMLGYAQSRCSLSSPEADVEALLTHVLTSTRKRNIVLLILDDIEFTPNVEYLLLRMAVQHQVLLVTVGDLSPADSSVSQEILLDLESEQLIPRFVHDDMALQRQIEIADAERWARRAQICTRLGIAHEQVNSSDEVIAAGLRLLERTRHVARS